jgi:ribosomal protein S18 acetylase RimI-like enzyme
MELADRAAAGHGAGWLKLRRLLNRGWLEANESFVAAVTLVPAHSFNGATVYGAFDRAELSVTLERVAASGLPFCLQARPSVADAAAEVARQLGMQRAPGMPLMVATEPPPPQPVEGLRLRPLGPDEGENQASVTAEAFDASLELMRELSTPELMARPGAHPYAGDLGAVTVTTAVADVNGETIGVYDVATRAAHRGRGYGSAVTAAAVRAGFADGGQLAFLLSSPMGVRVYEGLGFRELEQWSVWVSRPEV